MKKGLLSILSLSLLLPSIALAESSTTDMSSTSEQTTISTEETETTQQTETSTSETTTTETTSEATDDTTPQPASLQVASARKQDKNLQKAQATSFNTKAKLSQLPAYKGNASIVVNQNKPNFSKYDLQTKAFEHYSPLDAFGRVQTATANLTKAMAGKPGDRDSLSRITPSGFHSIKLKNGQYLYHRTHLIGYQLSGEQANPNNLMTGTNDLNLSGMKPYEDKVSQYLSRHPKNHVLYRVTPRFVGNEAVARGVQMEAKSVEDNGKGVQFNIYAFNNEPGVAINYQTGKLKNNSQEPKQPADTDHGNNSNNNHNNDASTAASPSTEDANKKTPLSFAIPGPILANPDSMIYHSPVCRHYSSLTHGQSFKTAEEAALKDFRPCKDLIEKFGSQCPQPKGTITPSSTPTPSVNQRNTTEDIVTETEEIKETKNNTPTNTGNVLPATGTEDATPLVMMGFFLITIAGIGGYRLYRRHA